jgi:hypothetical protein
MRVRAVGRAGEWAVWLPLIRTPQSVPDDGVATVAHEDACGLAPGTKTNACWKKGNPAKLGVAGMAVTQFTLPFEFARPTESVASTEASRSQPGWPSHGSQHMVDSRGVAA